MDGASVVIPKCFLDTVWTRDVEKQGETMVDVTVKKTVLDLQKH